jgi:hypothetical protein
MVAEGQQCDSGAVRIHDMNVALSPPVAIERDLRPIGRPIGIGVYPWSCRKLGDVAPVGIHHEDIGLKASTTHEGDPRPIR